MQGPFHTAVFASLDDSIAQRYAIVDEECHCRYGDLNVAADAIRMVLSQSVSGRPRVALSIACPRSYAAVLTACARLNMVPVACDPSWSGVTLRAVCVSSGSSFLIRDSCWGKGVRISLPTINSSVELQAIDTVSAHDRRRDEAIVFFTSGSTAEPKGVVHGDWALRVPYQSEAQEYKTWFSGLPVWGIGGHTIALQVLGTGGTLVITREFNPLRALRLWRAETVTLAALTPTQLRLFTRTQRLRADEPPKVPVIAVGGAPLDPAVAREAAKLFGAQIIETYGSTELGGGVAVTQQFLPDGSALAGFSLAEVELSVSAGSSGREGEIICQSPRAMLGYTDDTVRSERALTTGDIGSIDEDGSLHIRGRRDDVILKGGRKIYPEDVEMTLEEHPAVTRAGLIGIASGTGEVKLCALVQASTSSSALKTWVRRRLPAYQVPDRIRIVDEIPTTGNGKVARRRLFESACAEVAGLDSATQSI
jgi:acyl-coenzyme A synthetase/AMP-(fatty) acid ligase